jgi:hypothetical protein
MEAFSPELVLVLPPEEAARARALLPPPPTWTFEPPPIRPAASAPERFSAGRVLLVGAVAVNLAAVVLACIVSPRAPSSHVARAPKPVAHAAAFLPPASPWRQWSVATPQPSGPATR